MAFPRLRAILTILAMSLAGQSAFAQSVPLPKRPPADTPRIAQAAPPRPANPLPINPGASAPTPATPPALGKPGSAPTGAFDANQRALVDKVSAYLTSVRTLVGDFVQVGSNGARTQGQLYLQKPGRIRFEYDDPSPIQLIADGSSLVVRDRKLATQDLYPLSQTPLRFLLADRVDLLRDTNVIGVYSDDLFSTVVIEEKQTFGGTHRLMLMFGAKDMVLKQWTVTDPQGFDTTVALYNLDTSKRPDPSMFKINYERVLQ